MEYKVIVQKRAARMLVSHAAFLAKVSPEAANRLVTDFEEAANSLAVMPQRCPWFKGEFIPHNMYRYLLFQKRYEILFQVKDNTVEVDYIIDCRKDYSWLRKK